MLLLRRLGSFPMTSKPATPHFARVCLLMAALVGLSGCGGPKETPLTPQEIQRASVFWGGNASFSATQTYRLLNPANLSQSSLETIENRIALDNGNYRVDQVITPGTSN